MKKIIRNRIKCKKCGEIIESTSRHLNIDTLNSYTFGFREYTEEEMELEEAFQSGGVHKEIPVPKMSFEERMEALIRAQTQQD